MVVVKKVERSGVVWKLYATDTPDGHYCMSFRSGHRWSEGCGSIHQPGVRVPFGLSFVAGSGRDGSYVYGPVVSTAETVAITLSNGHVITTRTFAAPKSLASGISFYFTTKPCRTFPQVISGRDASGREVAHWSRPTSVAPSGLHRLVC
jgi:hypothetical protein